MLRGEAGIGKTALLEHLAASAHGCRLARATGIESEIELPFAGLHQLCAPLLDGRIDLPAPQRDALGVAFGIEAGPRPDRFLVGLTTLNLLAAAADEQPLVCLIDDGQWLDRASAQVIGFVARRVAAEALAIVVAVREPAHSDDFDRIPELWIAGLGDDDARAILRATIPWEPDERVLDRMLAEAGGNPLALAELPRGLSAAELDFGFGTAPPAPLVSRIEAGFVRQLEALSIDARRIVLLAAIEPTGDVALLRRAADAIGIAPDAALPAEAAGLLTFRAHARFRHPLARSAARRIASSAETRDAHRGLADAIDATADPDRHAWHRAHAATGPDEAIANDLIEAARRARRRGGFAAAATLMEHAVRLTPDPAQRGSRALAGAFAKLFAAEPGAGLELIAVAASCPLDDLTSAHLERLRASLEMAQRSDEGSQMLLAAAQRLQTMDVPSARGAYLGALSTLSFLGRLGDTARLRDAASAACAAPQIEPPRATDLLLDGLAARFTRGYGAAVPMLRRALRACMHESDPGTHLAEWVVFVPTLAPELWDDDVWRRLTTHLIATSRTAGGLLNLPMALDYGAGFAVQAGQFGTAALLIEEATVLKDATGSTPPLSPVELAAWRGDEGAATPLIDASIRLWTDRGEGRWISHGEYARAVLFNGLGRYREARTAAAIACEHDDLGILGRALAELVEAGARCGDTALVEAGVLRLRERTSVAGTDWARGVEARCRALAADGDDAEALYREAVARLAATHMQVDLARAQLLYGEWLRREQRRVDAREQLRAAHANFDGMGAQAFAERARRELVATGETVHRRAVQGRALLTPREAHVARLAGEGATNPEIGARLFVSPRTVEYHLHNVFTKLGIASRRELRKILPDLDAAGPPA